VPASNSPPDGQVLHFKNYQQIVFARAGYRCEYCHLPNLDSFYRFHIEHIISRRHGGKTALDNLALACPDCNNNKGTDLGTVLIEGGAIVPFFHPRKEIWDFHFEFSDSGLIVPKAETGKATVKFFDFNNADRVIERKLMLAAGFLP
jgi:hypothetical protein